MSREDSGMMVSLSTVIHCVDCFFLNSGEIAPFIVEQVDSIRREGIELDYFLIRGKGLWGYTKNLRNLRKQIRHKSYSIVHAHYGLSGLLANMQRKVPVITSFHGSDINTKKIRLLSRLAMKLSKHNIFMSHKMASLASARKLYSVIPCGVNLNTFFPMSKNEARIKLQLEENEQLILFSGSFTNKVKNYPLAKKAIESLGPSYRLIELKGYSREQVNLLLNACDVSLMTSFSEGSPQFIKEAMACNRPIVATDVGDVKEQLGKEPGCYLCSFKEEDVSEKILLAKEFSRSRSATNGRDRIRKLKLDTEQVAQKVISAYKSTLLKN